jgi:DNA (cytosine-5)-methyltransferase 1
MYRHDNDALTVMDWFCGAGGSSQGMHEVPSLRVERAANHWQLAIDSHEANFPNCDHYRGDIRKAPVEDWPITDLFWASPECTNWSIAKGKQQQDFSAAMQGSLADLWEAEQEEDADETPEQKAERLAKEKEEEESRALMEEVPLYLRGVQERGGLVKAGIVENVCDVRRWTDWFRWLGELHKLGYKTRVIALNSMHVKPRSRNLTQAPQSRDRLYVGYWHRSLRRDPDWDKWLRPQAWCEPCGEWVQAIQVFKVPGVDMGKYKNQYVYRCPRTTCRNSIVEPEVVPALEAIDWSIPGMRIGDRPKTADKPEGLRPKTIERIRKGLERFGRPTNDGRLALPPLVIPTEGRDGKTAGSVLDLLRTQTARRETALAWLPFITELRGGCSVARPVDEPLATFCASGNHHGLTVPPEECFVLMDGLPNIADIRFRTLEPHEVQAGMAFRRDYIILGTTKRDKVRQLGNAVTSNVADVLACALVEAITGVELSRFESQVDPTALAFAA